MKKIIKTAAFILSAGLMLGSIPVFAANFADVTDDAELSAAVAELSELGIVNGYEDGLFKPENKITRAEACAMMDRAIFQATSTDSVSMWSGYSDVSPDDWFYDSAAKMHDFGIINGYEDGSFKPQNNITYNEFIKMLMSMLFYGPYAEENGGYPHGYVSLAAELGITSGMTFDAGTEITRRDASIMLNRAIEAPFMLTSVFDAEGDSTYTRSDGVTYKDILKQSR